MTPAERARAIEEAKEIIKTMINLDMIASINPELHTRTEMFLAVRLAKFAELPAKQARERALLETKTFDQIWRESHEDHQPHR